MADSLKDKVELTAQDVINRLRLAVQPPGKKGLWLKDLSDKRLSEIYQRLRLNQPVYRIAKMVQLDWGMMKTSDIKTLGRGIRKFRERVLGEIQEAVAAKDITKEVADKSLDKGKRILAKLDALGLMRWALELQAERVQDLRDKEKSSMPFKFTGKEVERLYNGTATYIDLCIRLGLMDEKPKEINLTIKKGFNALIDKLPDDGSRLIDMTTKFLEEVDKLAIPMKQNPDGSYSEVKEKTEEDKEKAKEEDPDDDAH